MRRHPWLFLAALPTVLVLGAAVFVLMDAQHSFNRARTALSLEGRLEVEIREVGRRDLRGFETIASPTTYASGAFYQGKFYLSGPGGLSIFGPGDELLKTYRVGIDLPAAPLGQMVVARLRGSNDQQLIVATSGEGILIFAGEHREDGSGKIRQIRSKDTDARDVTALLPLPGGDLLIGTRRRGLLVYRGNTNDAVFESFHPQMAKLSVSALAGDDTGFWVGTRDSGVRHWHGGEMDSFESVEEPAKGARPSNKANSSGMLPDNQVDAIAVHGNHVFVGTPMGVEEFVDGQPARLLAKGFFAHALYADERGLLIGSEDLGIQRVSLDVRRRSGQNLGALRVDLGSSEGWTAEQFLRMAEGDLRGAAKSDDLYAITRDGLRRERREGDWTPVRVSVEKARMNQATLTDGNIAALSFGPDGRLWVGYFDRGLDILSADGRKAEHYEDDHLFCVNRIALDPRRKTMVVATANGLVLFDGEGKQRQVITKRDGLISDHVTDVAFSGEEMVMATPAGVTFFDTGGARSLYAFQGLVNNHVYALGVQRDGGDVLAGTLGGISVLRGDIVQRNFTATNSSLKHNWVTGIVAVQDGTGSARRSSWMVGTYGAGVMRLDGDGIFSPMDGVTQKMVVNPNAMLTTNAHVFAGTLGQGLWVWSQATDRWTQVTEGLPSETVTAIAERYGEVYVGTDNGLVRIAEHLLD